MMSKRTFLRMASCLMAVVMLCALTACGSDDSSGTNAFNESTVGASTEITEPTGTGFTLNHALEAGFGLGSDTLDDIRFRYGEPTGVETQEYTALTIVTAVYPFGEFVFNGTNGGTPVLTSVDMYSQYAAPFGIAFGDSVDSAVEKIYAGSAALLGGNYEQNAAFYGDGFTAPSGKFVWLTAEFTTTTSTARYAAEYIASGYGDGMNAKLTLYFNTDGQLVNYTLLYKAA